MVSSIFAEGDTSDKERKRERGREGESKKKRKFKLMETKIDLK